MFYICVIAFCFLELTNAHLLESPTDGQSAVLMQAQLVSIAFCAVFSKGCARHDAVLSVLAVWTSYIIITDWVDYVPPVLSSIETTAICMLIFWISRRPERLPSYSGDNVALAFYSGPTAPLIATVLSLPTLPYKGVALVVDGQMMMPRRKVGEFVRTDLATVGRGWTILGTPFKTTPEIKKIFNALEGQPVTMANCVSALRPALDIFGYWAITPGSLAMEVLDGGQ